MLFSGGSVFFSCCFLEQYNIIKLDSVTSLPRSPLLVLLEPLLTLQPEPLSLALLVPLLPGTKHGRGRRLLRAVKYAKGRSESDIPVVRFHSQVLLHGFAYLSDLALAFSLLPSFLSVLIICFGEYIHLHSYA